MVWNGRGTGHAYHVAVADVARVTTDPFACMGAWLRYTRAVALVQLIARLTACVRLVAVAYPLKKAGETATSRALDLRTAGVEVGQTGALAASVPKTLSWDGWELALEPALPLLLPSFFRQTFWPFAVPSFLFPKLQAVYWRPSAVRQTFVQESLPE